MTLAIVLVLLFGAINGFASAMVRLGPLDAPSAGAGVGFPGLVVSYVILLIAAIVAWRGGGWLWGLGLPALGFFILAPIAQKIIEGIYSRPRT